VHDDDEVRAWFQDVVLPKGDTWVLEVEEGLVGFLVLDDVWVDQLYMDPSWTRRGLGSTLLEFAKAVRPQGLDLWTFQANTGARRFYKRHGFIAVSETEGDNEEGAPDVRYHWDGR
jgi:GNAT superfamily N-acetyltransferase